MSLRDAMIIVIIFQLPKSGGESHSSKLQDRNLPKKLLVSDITPALRTGASVARRVETRRIEIPTTLAPSWFAKQTMQVSNDLALVRFWILSNTRSHL